MPDSWKVHNNGVSTSSNASADNLEAIADAMWHLKIQNQDNHQDGFAGRSSNQYPDRPGEPDCIYYLRTGMCGYGSHCRFNHPAYSGQGAQYRIELPERVGQPDCQYFLKTGTCKFGATCKFHHPRDGHIAGQVSLNILGLPMRQEEKSCPYYMRTWSCKFGVACKFHHPQPAALGTILPVAGATAIGSTGSSIPPVSGLSYVGRLPAWSLPRVPSMSSSLVQGPQGYMPVVLSPSQGIVASQQPWNAYMAEPGSSGQGNLNSTSLQLYPDRPEHPECQYYMKTGSCKFGSTCKYHHPRERIVPTASSLGPYGLPLRPGQAVCSFYSMYGICKYGPICKFDHPLTQLYNYSMSIPSLSISDPILLSSSYQKKSSTSRPSEASPSKSHILPDRTKPEVTSTKNENPDTKATEDPLQEEAMASPTPETTSSSEPLQENSD